MIRRLNGDSISYINNQKVTLRYLQEDIGELYINDQLMGKCSYSYAKTAIERMEKVKNREKIYIQDDEILFRELKVGTLINIKV